MNGKIIGNKLSDKQVSAMSEKVKYIREKTGTKYTSLLTLVNKCLKKKEIVPYREYNQFNSLYAETLQQSFDNHKVVNNKVDTLVSVPQIDSPDFTGLVCKIFNSCSQGQATQLVQEINNIIKERNSKGNWE